MHTVLIVLACFALVVALYGGLGVMATMQSDEINSSAAPLYQAGGGLVAAIVFGLLAAFVV